MPFHLRIPQAIHDAMLAHARAELPNECVGLLAGHADGMVVAHYQLLNELADPRRFLSDARSLVAAEIDRRARGLEFLAVYHSHPTSAPVPSGTDTDPDINYWCDADVMCLIVSLRTPQPEVRGYWLAPHSYREAEWSIVP